MQLKSFESIDHSSGSLHHEDDEYSLSSENSGVVVPSKLDSKEEVVLLDDERDEKSILQVDSSDSMPTYFMKKETDHSLIVLSDQTTQTDELEVGTSSLKYQQQAPIVSTNSEKFQWMKRDILLCVELIRGWIRVSIDAFISSNIKNALTKHLKNLHERKFFCLWFLTIMLVLYLSSLTVKQSQEISQLKRDLDLLRKILHDMEASTKVNESRGWFDRIDQGSIYLREWASSVIDVHVGLANNSDSLNSDATYLDIWPKETLNAFKHVSSSMTKLLKNKVDEVSAVTKEVISSVQGNIASVGDNIVAMTPITVRNQTLTEIVKNIWSTQQFHIIFELLQAALLFKIFYEKIFDNEDIISFD